MREPLHVGVLASGTGSNFRAIVEACEHARVRAKVVSLVTNRPGVGALEIAKAHGIPAHFVDPKGITREEHERAIAKLLEEANVGLVCLAGYMRLLTPEFVRRYPGKLVNIHPSLLPAFPGAHGIRDALASGVKVTGCTTHFVVEAMDAGPIIRQAAVPILEDDTEDSLASRIHVEEHRIYPETVGLFADGKLRVEGNRVRVLP